jgi:hypothetical protein
MMRWSFRTERWCWFRACARASAPPCCSYPPPPAPKLRRSGRRQRFASLRFRPDGVLGTPLLTANIDAPKTKSHRHGRWLFQFGLAVGPTGNVTFGLERQMRGGLHLLPGGDRTGWLGRRTRTSASRSMPDWAYPYRATQRVAANGVPKSRQVGARSAYSTEASGMQIA